ncbi:MAG: hypothetical protein ACXACI_08040 [Candidatus Hodarchaeales archaeon]
MEKEFTIKDLVKENQFFTPEMTSPDKALVGDPFESIKVNEGMTDKWYITLRKAVIKKKLGSQNIGKNLVDIFLVQVGFTARPPDSFTIDKVVVDIVFDKDAVKSSKAVNIGMAPKDEVDKTKIIRKKGFKPKVGIETGVGPTTSIELFEYSSTVEFSKEHNRIVQFYKGQPRAAWEIQSTPAKPEIIGDIDLELLVRQTANTSTPASMEVKAVARHTHLRNRILGIILKRGPVTDWDELSFFIK